MSTKELNKKTHARVSPSALPGLFKCCRYLFRRTEMMDDAAGEGESMHYSAQTGNLAGLDDYQKADVEKAIGYVEALKAGMSKNIVEFEELRVVLGDLTWGTADKVIVDIDNRTVHCGDYKFTRVSSDHDFQVETYSAAVVSMLIPGEGEGLLCKDGNRLWLEVDKVVTHIIAPRLGHAPEVHEFNATELLTSVRKRIEELYARINNPFEPPCADDPTLCARCSRSTECPAVNAIVVASAPLVGIPMSEVFDLSNPVVTPAVRKIRQDLAGLFDSWQEQAKKLNTEFVQQGGEIPGYKIQNRSTGFKIPRESTLAAAAILQEKLNLDVADILGAASLSIPELAKAMAETKGGKEQDHKAQLIDELREVGVQGSCSFLMKAGKGKKY